MNWLVVYDPADPHGAAIARHYQEARDVPESHLMAYGFPKLIPGSFTVAQRMNSTETWSFIEAIRAHLAAHGLSDQINGITLAGATPTVFENETASNSFGSLTAALWHAPNAGSAAELRLLVIGANNHVFRGPENGSSGTLLPTVSIDSQTTFNGQRYWMATHLGHSGAKGLRAEEVFDLIDRSVAADGQKVEGTVYWPLNSDVRSTTRANQVALTTPEWDALGLSYYIEGQSFGGNSGQVVHFTNKTGAPHSYPAKERLVQGQIVGRSTVPVETARNHYAPGAIAEHLTSFGGRVNALFDASQTAHTDWLRFGASGSSGTVVEPTAVWEKFPHARLHSHYYQGATLAEAFIQSVKYPVQLMVSGDPLTQPFATLPEVSITAPSNGATVSGSLQIDATATSPLSLEADLDLAIDGRIIAIGEAGESVTASRNVGGFLLDTTTLTDGWHDLRIVARNDDPIRSTAFARIELLVNNAGAAVTLNVPAHADLGENITIIATPQNLPAATAIEIRSVGRVLTTMPASGGTIAIPARALGYGENVRLRAIALTPIGEVSSAPQSINITWNADAAADRPVMENIIALARVFHNAQDPGFSWIGPADFTGAVRGLGELSFPTPQSIPFLDTASVDNAGVELITLFHADAEDVYDFAFDGAWMNAELLVNSEAVIPAVDITLNHVAYGSKRLAPGWHEIRIRLKPANSSMRFRPSVRARDTFFFEQYDFTYLDNNRCFAPADIALTPLTLAGRATSTSQADFSWNDPLGTETGFRIERFAEVPEVSLHAYTGNKTAPILEPAFSSQALATGAPVANDNTDTWVTVPPELRQGVRLLTAEADRTLINTSNQTPTNTLYQIQVPAGVTIYGIFHRNTPAASPQWMQAQGDWTAASLNIQSKRWPDWRVWKKAPTASAGVVELGHGDVPWGGAVSYVFINEPTWIPEATTAANATTTTVNGLTPGEHTFRLTATFPNGVTFQSPAIQLDTTTPAANGTPSVFAGDDAIISLPASLSLAGRAGDDGGGGLSYTWSKVSGPGTVTFGNTNAAATTATFGAPGNYTLQLSASDGSLTGTDSLTVTVLAATGTNQAPNVNAGTDRNTHTAASIQLAGSVSDDGLPALPGATTFFWRQLSGPAAVNFSDTRLLNPRVGFPKAGNYALELVANDGALTSTDTLQVTVAADTNAAPSVSTGPSATAEPGVPLALQPVINDDGLPNPPAALIYQWRQLSGPGTAVFSQPDSADGTVTFPQTTGTYVLELRVDDGGRVGVGTLTVEVAFSNEDNDAPEVTFAETEFTIVWLDTLEVEHTVSDDGLPNPPGALSYSWSVLTGPPGGEVRHETEADGSRSRLWLTEPGSYTLRFEVGDGATATPGDIEVEAPELATRNRIWYWGQNRSATTFRWGSSGTIDTSLYLPPTLSARKWHQVIGHSGLSVALDRDGNVWTQGEATDTRDGSPLGRLGEPGASPRFAFGQIPGLQDIVAIANGNTFAAAVDRDGQLFTWGNNAYYQLGLGESSTAEAFAPTTVPGMDNVRAIDAGTEFFIALLDDGTVRTWGRKTSYSLGNGLTAGNRGIPQDIGLSNVQQIAAGQFFGVALLNDGTLRSWGKNNRGQLGNGFRDSFGSRDEPSPITVLAPNGVDPFDQVTQIAAGEEFVVALREDGTVWMWGNNESGQAGQGNLTDKTLPTQVPGLPAGIVQVAAARRTLYALDADGQVWATGSNEHQLLGLPLNNPASRASVAGVTELPPIAELFANYRNVFARTPGATRTEFLTEHFTPAEQADPLISGEFVDPDGDTLLNVVERFLGTDPRDGTTRSPLRISCEGGQIRFSLTALNAPEGIDAIIEQSTHLGPGSWTPANPDTLVIEDHGDTRTWHYEFDATHMDRMFLRLRVQD